MCLDYVDKEIKETKGYGWKVFNIDGDGLYPQFKRKAMGRPYPIKEWIEDKRIRKIRSQQGPYLPGFHIFTTELDANRWRNLPRECTRRVKYDDVVATGNQSYREVIVARKIFIEGKE